MEIIVRELISVNVDGQVDASFEILFRETWDYNFIS